MEIVSVKQLLKISDGDLATVRISGVSVIARCPQGESWLYIEPIAKEAFTALTILSASLH